MCFFLCKQKTAYEMRIRDWSSDVCSSDLQGFDDRQAKTGPGVSGGMGVVNLGERRENPVDILFRNADSGIRNGHANAARCSQPHLDPYGAARSEERRVGKECVSPC